MSDGCVIIICKGIYGVIFMDCSISNTTEDTFLLTNLVYLAFNYCNLGLKRDQTHPLPSNLHPCQEHDHDSIPQSILDISLIH